MDPLAIVSDAVGYWHILFIDLVAYSQTGAAEQRNAINWLTKVVAESKVLKTKPKPHIIYLPTGDGMAVCLDNYPERTLELACELHQSYGKNGQQLRIGICSGIAFDIKDINRRPNLAGSGLNMAQRILNCCSPGHILVASMPGDDLAQMAKWQGKLRGPYQFKVKHGQQLSAFNFYDEARGVGNKMVPTENRLRDEKI